MEPRTKVELTVVGILVGAVVVLVLGCLIAPDTFWDGFVWKYFWGPIVADAGGDAGDISAEYNWVDTLTYGLVLIFSSYFIHRTFVKLDIRTGNWFFISLAPALIIGPAARVLEDMELFNEPLQYLFISPIIYIFIGLVGLGSVLAGYYLEKRRSTDVRVNGLFLFLPGLVISIVIEAFPDWISGNPSIIPILIITTITVAVFSIIKDRRMEMTVLFFWMQLLLVVVYFFILWLLRTPWYDSYVIGRGGIEPEMNLGGGVIIIVLLVVSTIVVAAGFKLASKKWEKAWGLLTWINIMIIGSHMTDASATFIGIDLYGYYEKHVVPSGLMDALDSIGFPYPGLVMYPLKLVFLIPAIYIMDVSMKKESQENPHMIALVKLAIIVLGFGPGVRDLLRIALGV